MNQIEYKSDGIYYNDKLITPDNELIYDSIIEVFNFREKIILTGLFLEKAILIFSLLSILCYISTQIQ